MGVDPPDAAIVRTDSLLERVQIRRDMIPIRVLVLDAVEVVGDDLVHQGDLGLNLRRLDGRDLDGAELLGHGLVRLLDVADLRRQRHSQADGGALLRQRADDACQIAVDIDVSIRIRRIDILGGDCHGVAVSAAVEAEVPGTEQLNVRGNGGGVNGLALVLAIGVRQLVHGVLVQSGLHLDAALILLACNGNGDRLFQRDLRLTVLGQVEGDRRGHGDVGRRFIGAELADAGLPGCGRAGLHHNGGIAGGPGDGGPAVIGDDLRQGQILRQGCCVRILRADGVKGQGIGDGLHLGLDPIRIPGDVRPEGVFRRCAGSGDGDLDVSDQPVVCKGHAGQIAPEIGNRAVRSDMLQGIRGVDILAGGRDGEGHIGQGRFSEDMIAARLDSGVKPAADHGQEVRILAVDREQLGRQGGDDGIQLRLGRLGLGVDRQNKGLRIAGAALADRCGQRDLDLAGFREGDDAGVRNDGGRAGAPGDGRPVLAGLGQAQGRGFVNLRRGQGQGRLVGGDGFGILPGVGGFAAHPRGDGIAAVETGGILVKGAAGAVEGEDEIVTCQCLGTLRRRGIRTVADTAAIQRAGRLMVEGIGEIVAVVRCADGLAVAACDSAHDSAAEGRDAERRVCAGNRANIQAAAHESALLIVDADNAAGAGVAGDGACIDAAGDGGLGEARNPADGAVGLVLCLDRAEVGTAGDRRIAIAHDAADMGCIRYGRGVVCRLARGDRAIVCAVCDMAGGVEDADDAADADALLGRDRCAVHAVFKAAVGRTGNAAQIRAAGYCAVYGHILDQAALAGVAEEVVIQAEDFVAVAVEGAGVLFVVVANSGPVVGRQFIVEIDICQQLCVVVGMPVCNLLLEPGQLLCAGNLIDACCVGGQSLGRGAVPGRSGLHGDGNAQVRAVHGKFTFRGEIPGRSDFIGVVAVRQGALGAGGNGGAVGVDGDSRVRRDCAVIGQRQGDRIARRLCQGDGGDLHRGICHSKGAVLCHIAEFRDGVGVCAVDQAIAAFPGGDGLACRVRNRDNGVGRGDGEGHGEGLQGQVDGYALAVCKFDGAAGRVIAGLCDGIGIAACADQIAAGAGGGDGLTVLRQGNACASRCHCEVKNIACSAVFPLEDRGRAVIAGGKFAAQQTDKPRLGQLLLGHGGGVIVLHDVTADALPAGALQIIAVCGGGHDIRALAADNRTGPLAGGCDGAGVQAACHGAAVGVVGLPEDPADAFLRAGAGDGRRIVAAGEGRIAEACNAADIIAGPGDRRVIAAVPDGDAGVSADDAAQGRLAGHRAFVYAVFHASTVASRADNAAQIGIRPAGDRPVVFAADHGGGLACGIDHCADDAAGKGVLVCHILGGDVHAVRAGFHPSAVQRGNDAAGVLNRLHLTRDRQILDGAIGGDGAEEAGAGDGGAAVLGQLCALGADVGDRMAVAVKRAFVACGAAGAAVGRDGSPVMAAQVNIRRQNGVAFGGAAVDLVAEPGQLIAVGDLIDPIDQGRLHGILPVPDRVIGHFPGNFHRLGGDGEGLLNGGARGRLRLEGVCAGGQEEGHAVGHGQLCAVRHHREDDGIAICKVAALGDGQGDGDLCAGDGHFSCFAGAGLAIQVGFPVAQRRDGHDIAAGAVQRDHGGEVFFCRLDRLIQDGLAALGQYNAVALGGCLGGPDCLVAVPGDGRSIQGHGVDLFIVGCLEVRVALVDVGVRRSVGLLGVGAAEARQNRGILELGCRFARTGTAAAAGAAGDGSVGAVEAAAGGQIVRAAEEGAEVGGRRGDIADSVAALDRGRAIGAVAADEAAGVLAAGDAAPGEGVLHLAGSAVDTAGQAADILTRAADSDGRCIGAGQSRIVELADSAADILGAGNAGAQHGAVLDRIAGVANEAADIIRPGDGAVADGAAGDAAGLQTAHQGADVVTRAGDGRVGDGQVLDRPADVAEEAAVRIGHVLGEAADRVARAIIGSLEVLLAVADGGKGQAAEVDVLRLDKIEIGIGCRRCRLDRQMAQLLAGGDLVGIVLCTGAAVVGVSLGAVPGGIGGHGDGDRLILGDGDLALKGTVAL